MSINVNVNGNSYSDIDSVRLPLADGSGYARFYYTADASNQNSVDLWEQGVVDGDGSNLDNANRIRTKTVIPDTIRTLSVLAGYEYAIVCLDASGTAPAGGAYYNFATGSLQSSAVYTTSDTDLFIVKANISGYHKFRLILRSTASTTTPISVAEAVNLIMIL